MITQAIPNLITFNEFLEGKPENGRYELHNTERVESVVFPELNWQVASAQTNSPSLERTMNALINFQPTWEK